MATIGSLSDAIIGKHFGQGLLAERAKDYALFTQCHNLKEMEISTLIFVTDKGKFKGRSRFVGAINFNILDVLFVDYENQLVYRCNLNYPIVVEYNKVINLNEHRRVN